MINPDINPDTAMMKIPSIVTPLAQLVSPSTANAMVQATVRVPDTNNAKPLPSPSSFLFFALFPQHVVPIEHH
jgi:hypothetical protein